MSHTNLTFDLNSGELTGFLRGRPVNIEATSGRDGSRADTGASRLSSVLLVPPLGGSIPAGTYSIEPPLGSGSQRRARLIPVLGPAANSASAGAQGGFAIHGESLVHTAGCIVPLRDEDFERLMDELAADRGGSLTVVDQAPALRRR